MKLADYWRNVTEANVGEIRMWGDRRFDAYGHETTSDIERRSEERREFRESCISGEVMELRSESMDKHTPGPWVVLHGCLANDSGFSIGTNNAAASGNVRVTAECWPCTIVSEDHRHELFANAQLIAAAPDLLEACRAMLTCCGGSDNWNGETHEALKKIEAAIAKATGAEHGR